VIKLHQSSACSRSFYAVPWDARHANRPTPGGGIIEALLTTNVLPNAPVSPMRMASAEPLFSVILVVFNGAATIGTALQSVLSQERSLFEIVVVDGLSTDGTLDIVRSYADKIAVRISEADRGIYDAMNKGVAAARGRWIYFLGADDTLCDCVETVAKHLADDRTIYYGDVYKTGSRTIYGGSFGPWRLLRKNICHQAIFYPRSVFNFHQFNLEYPLYADWELNLRCYADSRFRFQHVPITIANYNDASGASSVMVDAAFATDQGRIIRECLPFGCYIWYRIKRGVHFVVDRFRTHR